MKKTYSIILVVKVAGMYVLFHVLSEQKLNYFYGQVSMTRQISPETCDLSMCVSISVLLRLNINYSLRFIYMKFKQMTKFYSWLKYAT